MAVAFSVAAATIVTTMFARQNSLHLEHRTVLVHRIVTILTITSQLVIYHVSTRDFLLPLLQVTSGAWKLIGTLAQTPKTSTSSWWWPTCPQTTRKSMPPKACLWSKVAPLWRQSVKQLTEKPMNAAKHFNRKNSSSVSHWQLKTGHRAQEHLVFLQVLTRRFNWPPNRL